MNKRLIIGRPPEPDPHPALLVERGKAGKGVGRWVSETKHLWCASTNFLRI